ncbi:MAG: enoyl-CoA hydratase-related protein [Mycobacterium sp.]|nr:enoyl-CoA hydratase-related protein [Mycobacterium sp.]
MTEQADPTAAPGPDGTVAITRDGPILRLVLDRPEHRNSLSHRMIDQFVSALTDAATDDTLRAVHITGSGDNFCSGADWVTTNNSSTRPRAGDLLRRIPLTSHRIVELIATIAVPVVCSVRGWAVGLGCNLALAADFTVAADDAVFWEPFITRGFSPDSGASWLLPRLVGVARARRMLLLGEKVTGADAAGWGMVHQSVPPETVTATAHQLLSQLANGPTVALGLAKQGLAFGQHTTLPQAMNQELHNLELSCRTADFKEGLAAFKNRRDPGFTGR